MNVLGKRSLTFLFSVTLFAGLVGCGKDFKIKNFALDQEQILDENINNRTLPYENIGGEFVRYLPSPEEEKEESLVLVPEDLTELHTQSESEKKANRYSLAKGKLNIRDLEHQFDASKSEMKLKGEISFSNTGTSVLSAAKFSFSMSGTLNKIKNNIEMAVDTDSPLKEHLRAIVSCLDNSCEDFYINFYYLDLANRRVYTDQFIPKKLVEIPEPAPSEPTPAASPEAEPTPEPERAAPAVVPVVPLEKPEEKILAKPKIESPKATAPESKPETKVTPQAPSNPDKVRIEVDTEESDPGQEEITGLTPGAFVGPTPAEIIDLFPVLREEKKAREKIVAERQRDKPPAKTPNEGSPVGMMPPLKPLGPIDRDFPEAVKKVLAPLAVGIDQAQSVQKVVGSLKNAVDLRPQLALLGPLAGFRILEPERAITFGTSELVGTIIKIGQWILDYLNIANYRLDVRNMSVKNGGRLAGHAAHQNGLDADLGYLFTEPNDTRKFKKPVDEKGKITRDFLVEKQWELFKALVGTGQTEFIMVSPVVKTAICSYVQESKELLRPETMALAVQTIGKITPDLDRRNKNHDSHFHLRIKCGPLQRNCRNWGLGKAETCPLK